MTCFFIEPSLQLQIVKLQEDIDQIYGWSATNISKWQGRRNHGARGALAPLKFAKGGLSPPYVMAYNTDCLLK